MSYEEKNAVTSLLSTLIIFTIYFFQTLSFYQSGLLDGPDATSFLGKAILVLIFGGMVVTIVITILFNIVHAIITHETKPSFIVDERDRFIELRALRISYYVLGVGFVGSMIVLAMGNPAVLVLNLIVFSFGIATFVEAAMRLVIYRRGF